MHLTALTLIFMSSGLVAVNGMTETHNNVKLSTNAWYDRILKWIKRIDIDIKIDIDINIKVNTTYSRCSGDPHGFIVNENDEDNVLCFDIIGTIEERNYLLYAKNVYDTGAPDVKITCEDGTMELNCDNSEELKILYADYGRTEHTICQNGSTANTNCHLDNALGLVRGECDGLTSCQFDVTDDFFQDDPCNDTYKYATVDYQCQERHPIFEVFQVIGHFKDLPGKVTVIDEITFCIDGLGFIIINFDNVTLYNDNGGEQSWSWGTSGVNYSDGGFQIKSVASGNMFVITFILPAIYNKFEIMRPGDYLSIKAYGDDLEGLMGQIHSYNIYTNSNYTEGVGEVNQNGNLFFVEKINRGNFDCWFHKGDPTSSLNPVYGDVALFEIDPCYI